MAIEVRELIIRATVTQSGNNAGSAQGTAPAAVNEEIIKACIEKVLEIIKDKHGR